MAKKYFNLIVIIFLVFSSINRSQTEDDSENQGRSIYSKGALSVTVGGSFITNGTFAASPTERVDQFITRIFNRAKNSALGLSSEKDFIQKTKKEIEKYAERNIILKRYEGESIEVDLKKFRLTGNFKYNPYLKNGDVLIFPEYDKENNSVTIDGAVNKPTSFQYSDGDSLSDAILFAHGINKAYENVDTAEISRLSYDGDREVVHKVALEDNFALKRGDRIRVLANDPKRKDYKVLVLGEVSNPGFVYLTNNNTMLREVISKSGGFTQNASLKSAELLRNYTSSQILKKNAIMQKEGLNYKTRDVDFDELYKNTLETLRMYRLTTLTFQDTSYFNIDNDLRLLESRSAVDFTKINEPNSPEGNFIVKDGDLIIVPEKQELVYVFGQVPNRGYYKFVNGKDYTYYVNKSGGLTETAEDLDEVIVIKGDSRDWKKVSEGKVKIEPGDFVYVPKDPPKTFGYYLSRINAIAGVVGSIATVILLVVQLGK